MTVINQSPHIFNTTIRENLKIAKDNATEEELLEALEKVELKNTLNHYQKVLILGLVSLVDNYQVANKNALL